MRRALIAMSPALVAFAALAACGDSSGSRYVPPPLSLPDASSGDAAPSPGDASSLPDAAPAPDASGTDASMPAGACTTRFRYVPPPGTIVRAASLAGEWNAFASSGTSMTQGMDGAFTATVPLAPGLVAYKLVLDGNFTIDPGARYHKYVGGVENSAVLVTDCHLPTLSLASKTLTRPAAGQGRFNAIIAYADGVDGAGLDPASVKATLRRDDTKTAIAGVSIDASRAQLTVDVPSLADGKYSVLVDARDRAGHAAKTLRLVFWVESEAFDWRDAVLYMVMADRFKNGDTSNDATMTAGVDSRADFQGGDLQGLASKVEDGTLDALGVRAIWLSPFHTNPAGAFPAADGLHQVTGYHGYWPTRAREVERRIGGDAGLRRLVASAHAHGIRIVQDFPAALVHQDHEYLQSHPDWFIHGCVCGTNNCDWTAHRLDCVFATYLPRVDWTQPAVDQQWADDAVWWADTYDVDGLRIDAVKHVPDIGIINLTARMRDEFEVSGQRFFMTGETAMGWSGDTLASNQDQYDTISRYIGPHGLDGQFDFVLYHAVSYRVFDYDQKGLAHADYWTQASGWEYPLGSIMSPFIGSQDTPRMVTLASYRGQDAAHDPGIPGNQWDNVAGPPPDEESYQRQRLAEAWLFGLPGAPMLYYGDEYAEWGGADPNNRKMWRGDQALSTDEQATLAFVRKLGQARKSLVALRRGDYRPVYATDDALVFARQTPNADVALVALTRLAAGTTITATLPVTLPLPEGTVLHDRLGGPDVTVAGGAVNLTLGARGAAILAP